MSSFIRNLQRRAARKNPDYESQPQVTQVRDDGSYRTLRPTKGWLEMSAIRYLATMKLAQILEKAYVPRVSRKKPSKVWKETQPKPMVQGRETRQQLRAAARGYVGGTL